MGRRPGPASPHRRRPRPAGRRRRPDAPTPRCWKTRRSRRRCTGARPGAAPTTRWCCPGGHRARGMRPYLESPEVQQMAIDAFRAEKPVGAICHGVLVAARAVDPVTERSVLYGRRTTALTWALERQGMGHRPLHAVLGPDYYRTYVEEPGQRWGYLSVQQEVTRALADPADFADVEKGSPDWRRKTSGRARDTLDRRAPRLGRARRLLRVGPLARRCAHLRPDLRRRCWPSGPDASAAVEHEVERPRRHQLLEVEIFAPRPSGPPPPGAAPRRRTRTTPATSSTAAQPTPRPASVAASRPRRARRARRGTARPGGRRL